MNILRAKRKNKPRDIVRYTMLDDETVFVFVKKKRIYGTKRNVFDFYKEYTPVIKESEEHAHSMRIKRIIKLLKESGLWPELIEFFENLDTLPYHVYTELKCIYHSAYTYQSWIDAQENIRHKYEAAYPFLFKNGALCTNYFDSIAHAELKSMYFGKNNKQIKELIRQHISEHKNITTGATTTYDVSFQYDAEQNKAWYTEHCKNHSSHYYLALNENTALFVEDD